MTREEIDKLFDVQFFKQKIVEAKTDSEKARRIIQYNYLVEQLLKY